MQRSIQRCSTIHSSVEVSIEEKTLAEWISCSISTSELWLLAHLDDGVVWGKRQGHHFLLSSDTFPEVSPPLRWETLSDLRVFGKDSELYLWRNIEANMPFTASRLIDLAAESDSGLAEEAASVSMWDSSVVPLFRERFDEEYLLWGNTIEDQRDGFTLWREGANGLRHATPTTSNSSVPPCLVVRHYLASENAARVACSRLVILKES